MSKLDELSDRLLLAAGRMPGPAVAALALVFYAGGGLALPILLGVVFLGWDTVNWSVPFIVMANLYSTTLAALVVLSWLSLRVEARERRHLLEWTTDLRHLNSEEFEWLVGEVFRREGWEVEETGSQEHADGNIDLAMAREGKRAIVQCKLWQSWRIGVKEIREFGGTLLREGLQGSEGIFVTIGDIREQARAEAKTTGITLVDKYELHSRMERVRRVEPCPICGKPMVFGRSSYGWWFHCVAGCPGKRDLGKDPGRAVEFLTQPPTA
jgi:HJR/Mrr/RecB family endonuclease